MSLRRTTALVNKMAQGQGLRHLLANGRFYVYSGTQPEDADSAPAGTLLVVFSLDGGDGAAYVDPVRAIGTVTLTGTGGDSVDSIKLGGMAENLLSAPVLWNTDLATTAAAVAANINNNQNAIGVVAESAAGVISLYAPFFMGADADGLTVTSSVTAGAGDLASADAAFAGGVSALNGLNFSFPSVGGVIQRPDGADWSGLGVADGNAGWFRYVSGGATPNGAGADNVRFDGQLATSGGDLTVGSLAIKTGSVQTFGQLTATLPKNQT